VADEASAKGNRWLIFLGLLIFLALVISISGGIAIALGYTPRSRVLGLPLFLTATTAAVYTVDRWARGLGVVFGTAALNGLITLTSGHALSQPSVPVPRVEGTLLLLLGILASTTTARLSQGTADLSTVVRTACLGILACAVASIVSTLGSVKHWETPTLIAFVSCLLTLWAGTTSRATRRRNKRP
jgi:hypothetical protein